MTVRIRSLTAVAALFALGATSCNDHVFTVVEPLCHAEEVTLNQAELGKPIDILIVVDNSGSMCEEQTALKQSFLDPNCVITDINNPPQEFINPTPDQVEELSQTCGFIQILSLFEATDFRLGVITTDVSACDNALQQANSDQFLPFNCFGQTFPDRGRNPQRGCLQPPAFDGGRKFLQLGDDAIDTKFNNILDNVQTWGSGFERGLDATVAFLQADVQGNAECADDAENFLRDDARLAVIYITDEDDCSHGDAFEDENVNITCTEGATETFTGSARDCYDQPDRLTDTNAYVQFLQQFKPNASDVKIAVIGGAVGSGGNVTAGGCTNDNNTPSGNCNPSKGASNIPQTCGPGGTIENCCEADGSGRYIEFANGFGEGNRLTSSICQDFRDIMIDVAEFLGRVEGVELRTPPPNPNEIIVVVQRRDGTEEFLKRIDDDVADPDAAGEDGFQYDGGTNIAFFGPSAPQPGDEVAVHYAANPVEDPCGELNE